MDIKELLINLGLLENDIEVYLASLQIGEASIVPIQKKLGLPRTTVYHSLERLRDRGLIEIMETPTRRIYVPYSPRKILTLLKNQEEKLREQADDFQKYLPEFSRLYSSSPVQPKVRFFRGLEIREIYEEILEIGVDEFWYAGEIGKAAEILGTDFFRKWVPRKVEKGIWTRSLRIRPDHDQVFDPKSDLRKVRYLPEGFDCPVHFNIYGDNVAVLTSATENFGVVTTSRDYARAMKSWYQALWDISTPA